MKHVILLILALLFMIAGNAQTRKSQMRKMGQMVVEDADKAKEREVWFDRTDKGNVMQKVKQSFCKWNEIKEFEKTTAYEQRLQHYSKLVFDSMCYNAIRERIGHYWQMNLEKYNADKEYFPITCNFKGIKDTVHVSVPIAEAPDFKKDFLCNKDYQTEKPMLRFGNFVYVQNAICPTTVLVNRVPYWIEGSRGDGHVNSNFFVNADTARISFKNVQPLVVRFDDLGIKNRYLTNYVYVFAVLPMDAEMRDVDTDKLVNVDTDKVYDIVEQQPMFPNGPSALMKFISENTEYPVAARENGVGGRVTVQFVIEKDGYVSNVHVLSGVDPLLDKEAVRVVKSMPKWIPGKQNGKCVRVNYRVPVLFR